MTILEPVYDKQYKCIYCQKPFSSKKVRSRFVKISRYDTDFFPLYNSNDSNPLFYHIQICPSCGFSFSDDFSNIFPPGSMEIIHEKVTSQWVPRDFGSKRTIQQAVQANKLAIYCGTLKKEKHIVLAGLYIRTAWLYRSIQNADQEQRFMKLSIKEYENSYYKNDFQGTQISEVKLLYLIGELSRRINDNQMAVQYFSRVIERQKKSVEPKIIDMARERWYEIREKVESKKGNG